MPCSDCVAYSKGGTYYLTSKYTKSSSGGSSSSTKEEVSVGSTVTVEQKDLSWASDVCIWMPKSIAKKVCTISSGYDQPAEHNIHSQPLKTEFSFECCNECAKVNGEFLLNEIERSTSLSTAECKSWVFKASSKECYLKNQYDVSKTIPCSDCIAYTPDRGSFAYQTVVTVTKTFPLTSSQWTSATFGGSGWAQATQSDACRFVVGRDQSTDYDLGVTYTDNLFDCCDACKQNDSKGILSLRCFAHLLSQSVNRGFGRPLIRAAISRINMMRLKKPHAVTASPTAQKEGIPSPQSMLILRPVADRCW